MNDLPASTDNVAHSSDTQDVKEEFAAFSKVVNALESLSPESRVRIFRTLATFFNVPLFDSSTVHARSASRDQGTAASPSYSDNAQHSSSFSEDRSLSPKEFILQKKPMSDVERVTCLAYYLTHYRNEPAFKTLEISQLNTEAAQVKLSNAAYAVDNAAKQGWLIQGTKGNKQLSAKGELYVQALPDRVKAKEAIEHFRKPRKKSRSNRATQSGDGGETSE